MKTNIQKRMTSERQNLCQMIRLHEFVIFLKGESVMKTHSALYRTLQALFITGISIFALAPAFAKNHVQVTADNYVRTESDFQMKGYIEILDCFGKLHHRRTLYDVETHVKGN